MSLDRLSKWVFPVGDENGVELAYADAIPARHRGGATQYLIGALRFSERDILLLRAFLNELERAPQGTEIVECRHCGCTTVLVDGELMGTDNSGAECEEHECAHSHFA